jgi:hypothetical protein
VSTFGQEQLKVVYTDSSVEFHATEDRQTRDEELIHSLYQPMLAMFIITDPVSETVARKPDWDDDFVAEMKAKVPGAADAFEGIQLWEQFDLHQKPTRQAYSFPLKLLFMDGEGMGTGPEGHAGLEFLKSELGAREIVTVAEIQAIADKFKSRPR